MPPITNNLGKCRLCMTTLDCNTVGHSIIKDHLNERISSISASCFGDPDILPKRICSPCRYQVEKFYMFREKALKTQEIFLNHTKLVGPSLQIKTNKVVLNYYLKEMNKQKKDDKYTIASVNYT